MLSTVAIVVISVVVGLLVLGGIIALAVTMSNSSSTTNHIEVVLTPTTIPEGASLQEFVPVRDTTDSTRATVFDLKFDGPVTVTADTNLQIAIKEDQSTVTTISVGSVLQQITDRVVRVEVVPVGEGTLVLQSGPNIVLQGASSDTVAYSAPVDVLAHNLVMELQSVNVDEKKKYDTQPGQVMLGVTGQSIATGSYDVPSGNDHTFYYYNPDDFPAGSWSMNRSHPEEGRVIGHFHEPGKLVYLVWGENTDSVWMLHSASAATFLPRTIENNFTARASTINDNRDLIVSRSDSKAVDAKLLYGANFGDADPWILSSATFSTASVKRSVPIAVPGNGVVVAYGIETSHHIAVNTTHDLGTTWVNPTVVITGSASPDDIQMILSHDSKTLYLFCVDGDGKLVVLESPVPSSSQGVAFSSSTVVLDSVPTHWTAGLLHNRVGIVFQTDARELANIRQYQDGAWSGVQILTGPDDMIPGTALSADGMTTQLLVRISPQTGNSRLALVHLT